MKYLPHDKILYQFISVILIIVGIILFAGIAVYDLTETNFQKYIGKSEFAGLAITLLFILGGYILYVWSTDRLSFKNAPFIGFTISIILFVLTSFVYLTVKIQSSYDQIISSIVSFERISDRVQHLQYRTHVAGKAISSLLEIPSISLTTVTSGLTKPVYITSASDDSRRLFIVEKSGVIRILKDGEMMPKPFLDIAQRVRGEPDPKVNWEQGLLGLAFHPKYANNGRFFANYTAQPDGRTVVAEFHTNPTSNHTNPDDERVILELDQPNPVHNGGHLAFGPEGLLYIGLGDGGGGGDPHENAQDKTTLLGSILRINIDVDDFPNKDSQNYGIPKDNPFVGDKEARPEIFAYGFRNPWRFTFDSATGRIFVGDVGQARWEEINIVKKGQNYGWDIMEGRHCYEPRMNCKQSGLTFPIVEYGHLNISERGGNSVTGGYIYRGNGDSKLQKLYLFADFVSTRLWAAKELDQGDWWISEVAQTDFPISSFGEGPDGELYVVDYTGKIHLLTSSQ